MPPVRSEPSQLMSWDFPRIGVKGQEKRGRVDTRTKSQEQLENRRQQYRRSQLAASSTRNTRSDLVGR